jgi:molybdopterin-guanine dinucleotide biosynthesis protein A
MLTLSAVLLAGGESRRMGRDKATLYYREKPMWQRQLELLRRLSPLEILISARTQPTWCPPDARFVSDAPPSRGPLSGLAAAMAVMQGTHLLTLAIDMPVMTDAYLRNIWGLAEAGKGVLPVMNSRPEPLAAIYPIESCSHIGAALQTISDFSLRSVAEKLVNAAYLRVIQVEKKDEVFFRNLNSPADVT